MERLLGCLVDINRQSDWRGQSPYLRVIKYWSNTYTRWSEMVLPTNGACLTPSLMKRYVLSFAEHSWGAAWLVREGGGGCRVLHAGLVWSCPHGFTFPSERTASHTHSVLNSVTWRHLNRFFGYRSLKRLYLLHCNNSSDSHQHLWPLCSCAW